MIYLDNAAYIWPKPQAIQMQIAQMLTPADWYNWEKESLSARETIAALFNARSSTHVCFTRSARDALEWVLNALLHPGQHVITSSVEHEAVMTPLHRLQQRGIEVTVVGCAQDGAIRADDIFAVMRSNTRAVVLVHASNVAGAVQPLAEISAKVKRNNVLLIVDAAQTAGVYPIDMDALDIDVLVFTGHKGLFGPVGTGGFVAGSLSILDEIEKNAEKEGLMCPHSPTLQGLRSLTIGVRHVLENGVSTIRQHEVELTARMLSGLRQIPGVSVYGPVDPEKRIGIVCFNVQGLHPQEVARLLETEYDIVCRAGIHHSPESHRTLGTWPEGAVRFSVGLGNNADDVDYAVAAVESIAKRYISSKKVSSNTSNRDNRRLRILIVPQVVNAALENSEWYALRDIANVTLLDVEDESYLLAGGIWGADLNRCLEMARSCSGNFDLIIAECTGAFLWHAVFRLAGDRTPFAIIPHFNHVAPTHAFATLLSSQLALPDDIVFAGSTVASCAFAQYGFCCKPLYPPGIDLGQFRPLAVKKSAIRASLGLPGDVDLLLYTGRVEEDKNVLELLDVYKLVAEKRRVELIICYHFWNEHYLEECQSHVPKTGNVHFVRDPNLETLTRYYNAADLFVSTAVSDFETFGRSPVEAMACGLPPVVSEYNGFRETVSPDCGVLIPTVKKGSRKYPDIAAFAQVISTLLGEKQTLYERGQRGIQHIQRFERRASLQAMLENFRFFSENPRSVVLEPPKNLSVEKYPAAIRSLWLNLEGKPIVPLMEDFLRTGQIPVQPMPEDIERFHEFWFAEY
ncbi:MAG: aminotransferase class V-fold PLP-dependent enzyme [Anaerolineales bacterium]